MATKPPTFRPLGMKSKTQRDRLRPSSATRGYGTDWRKLREQQPKTGCRHPGCDRTKWEPSFHLDHIVAKAQGGLDVASNLQWLCRRHHSAKTAKQDGRWGAP